LSDGNEAGTGSNGNAIWRFTTGAAFFPGSELQQPRRHQSASRPPATAWRPSSVLARIESGAA